MLISRFVRMLARKPTFLRLVEILAGHKPAFERQQRENAENEDGGKARKQVHPPGRGKGNVDPDTQRDRGNAGKAKHKERRAVGRIGEREVKPANLAPVGELEEAVEDTALPHRGQRPRGPVDSGEIGGQSRVVSTDAPGKISIVDASPACCSPNRLRGSKSGRTAKGIGAWRQAARATHEACLEEGQHLSDETVEVLV